MRILYICGDQGIPVFGRKGASTHLREMIAAFRALGHEIRLAAVDVSGDRRPDEDFPVIPLPAPRSRLLGLDGRYLVANWLARRALLSAARAFRPHALYERSALYFTAGQWLARRLGIPRILEVNSFLAHEQAQRLHFPRLAHAMEQRLHRHSMATAAISSHMRDLMVAQGCDPRRIRPFPMAVDPERFQPPADPLHRRRQLGWPDDALVLGYVGSMNSYHRPNWFVDLAEKVLRRGERRCRFLVVGGSPSKVQRHRSRLLPWVDEGLVHFTGSVPQTEMVEWLAAMSAVLIPGASPQSTPTKIFEAAAVGRPLILPATEPIRELCGPDSPFLFQPNDFAAFERKVRSFCDTPADFLPAAAALRDKVVTQHTWMGHAHAITAWFGDLASA